MSFFHKAFAFLIKVFTNTDWTHAAQVGITVAAPLVETLATLIGGAAVGGQVANIMNTIKTDFGVVTVTLSQIQAGSANSNTVTLLKNTLASIQTNLPELLVVADIKDAATKQRATAVVTMLTGEIGAVLSSIPATMNLPVAA